MNLETIRKEWERKQTTILVVTKKTGDYSDGKEHEVTHGEETFYIYRQN